jgi:drug/metabolite transporter (DMT)-like permease
VDPDARRGRIYVVLAALVWSSAGVLQRELDVGTATQLAGRAIFALLGLVAWTAVQERRSTLDAFRGMGVAGVGFAVSVAVSSGSFIAALNHTTVANVLFMQAASPIVAALLAWIALGEAIAPLTWLAMAIAMTGVGLMVGAPGVSALGIGLPILMMLSFAVGIVLARHRSDISMAPSSALAQFLVFVAFAPFAHPGQVGGRDLGLLVALGIGQIGLGLALLSLGARLIPAAEIALITLLEVVLGPLWVWIFLSEEPSTATLIGGGVVMLAVLLQSSASAVLRRPQVASPHP